MAASEFGELKVLLGRRDFVVEVDGKEVVRDDSVGRSIVMAERVEGERAERLFERLIRLEAELSLIER